MATTDNKEVYDLYVFPFSLYSMMTRFTANLGGKSDTAGTGPQIQLKMVNLQKQEQLSEEYLAINPTGQVPSLTGPGLSKPLNGSKDVCDWLCEQYPKLLPEQHKDAIENLLAKMRSFHAIGVSFPKGAPPPPNMAEEMLKRDDLSPSYRKALEFKRDFHRDSFEKAMDATNVSVTEAKAADFLKSVQEVYKVNSGGGMWLFGDSVGPTVLDGHVGPFLARLLGNEERRDMVPDELREYLRGITALEEWTSVIHDRPTMYNPSMGPLEKIPL